MISLEIEFKTRREACFIVMKKFLNDNNEKQYFIAKLFL